MYLIVFLFKHAYKKNRFMANKLYLIASEQDYKQAVYCMVVQTASSL